MLRTLKRYIIDGWKLRGKILKGGKREAIKGLFFNCRMCTMKGRILELID